MRVFLSVAEAAKRQGITRDGFYVRLRRHPLAPDAMIGSTRGWLPETIDDYAATIPAPGPAPQRQEQP